MINSENMSGPIHLSVVTHGGRALDLDCVSVRFNVPDGEKNKNSGGSVGIRKGHADALMSLKAGCVKTFSENGESCEFRVGNGIAMVGSNRVTLITDTYSEADKTE